MVVSLSMRSPEEGAWRRATFSDIVEEFIFADEDCPEPNLQYGAPTELTCSKKSRDVSTATASTSLDLPVLIETESDDDSEESKSVIDSDDDDDDTLRQFEIVVDGFEQRRARRAVSGTVRTTDVASPLASTGSSKLWQRRALMQAAKLSAK